MRTSPSGSQNLRQAARLPRTSGHSWQIHLEDDRLITKNIINLSPSGMAFKAPTSSEIHPGQTLKFSLSIEPGVHFDCEGQVLWVKAAADRSGSMRQIGMQFSKLPSVLDAAIVKQTNDYFLQTRRERIDLGRRPLSQKIVLAAPPKVRSLFSSIVGGLLVVALSTAFVMALWIHQKNHPEESIAKKFNDGLTRKLSSAKDP